MPLKAVVDGVGIGARKHERGAGVARRADRAEHIGVGVTLIPWAGAAASPSWPTDRPGRSSARPAFHPGTRPRPALPPLPPCRRSPPPPIRESFFKSRDGLRVLLGMPRTRADVGKAKLLEGTANRHLVEIDIEAFLDDAPEVHASPTHDAISGGIGAGFHDPPQFLLLLSRQFGYRPGSFAIDEPRGALRVEAMRPVAQRLPVHGSNLGGGLAAHPVENGRQRQKPPRLICIPRPLRQLPQFARTEVRAQWHCCAHRPPRESFPLKRHGIKRPAVMEYPVSESGSTKLGITCHLIS